MSQYENRNQTGKLGWGMILIIFGALMILGNLGIVPSFGKLIGTFWPMIIIFGALMFHVGYYSNKNNVGLLVPGGILLTVGIVCQTSVLWNIWGFMWPGFILAPAVGLFELYIFGDRQKGLLIPVGILTGISLIFFSASFNTLGKMARFIIPAVLIFIGIVILARDKRQQGQNDDFEDQNDYRT